MPPEHPAHPIFSSSTPKSTPVGKASSGRSITVNIIAHDSSYTEIESGEANIRFRIYEINNNSDRNWVRTAFDSGDVDVVNIAAGETLVTGVINATNDVDTFYATRIEYDDGYGLFSMGASFAASNTNGFEWSQGATHPGTFNSDSEINARISNNVSVGSGFPSASLNNTLPYDVIKLANTDPLWAFIEGS